MNQNNQPNILFITADDLNYNTIGAYGCEVDNITPNLDKLSAQGMKFDNAHVTIAICQPSRQSIMTGLYPHNNGSPGFNPIREDVTTLTEVLSRHGYLNGIIGKVEHLQPQEKFAWDYVSDVYNFTHLHGRSPYIYKRDSRKFFQQAKDENKPFFYMVNSHDPHRPFAGSEDELTKFYGYTTYASRYYKPEEVTTPGFLPDLPEVRKEIAEYYSSVHRCDETVGGVLEALEEAGFYENTLVIFLSDNGMAFPFAKANCYLNSTKTPFLVRWPKVVQPSSHNTKDYIAGIDFTPTILDAVGLLDQLACDGRSYLPLLKGEQQADRDVVFTQFNTTHAKDAYPMRCIQSDQYGYIYNGWSDGTTLYKSESKTGLTYKAMKTSERKDVQERVAFYDYRCREEFYDFSNDPDGLQNLIDDPAYSDLIKDFKQRLLVYLETSGDPMATNFSEFLDSDSIP